MSENINNARFIHITWYKITRDLAIYIADRWCVSSGQKVKTVNFSGRVFNGARSIQDTGGGGRYRNHKFQGGIVFHGEEKFVTPLVAAAASINLAERGSFSREETFVTPQVAAAMRPRRPLTEHREIYIPYLYSTATHAGGPHLISQWCLY